MARSAIAGVGVDLVEVVRIAERFERTPAMRQRIFTEAELEILDRGDSSEARARSLAGRFAAKEAIMKSLGVGIGEVDFHDLVVVGGRGSQPTVKLEGRAKKRAEELGVIEILLSISHDGPMATAMAVASRECS
jgi:holo-[acyl-carrier protein] synthase